MIRFIKKTNRYYDHAESGFKGFLVLFALFLLTCVYSDIKALHALKPVIILLAVSVLLIRLAYYAVCIRERKAEQEEDNSAGSG